MKLKNILCMLTLLCTVAQGAWAWDYDYPEKKKPQYFKSYGGRPNVVVIKTEGELAYITEHFDDIKDKDNHNEDFYEDKFWWEQNYYLDADLDMGNSWLPMGLSNYPPEFVGTFWGNGHTIKFRTWGLEAKHQGLFACIGWDGKVYDVNVICDIDTEYNYVGAIAGHNNGSIVNCTAAVNITANDIYYAGGIAGRNYGDIKNCRVSGTIKGLKSTVNVGGIAGANAGNITNCWVSADVSSEHDNSYTWGLVGGIVGENHHADFEIAYCCMTGKVSNPKDAGVGGIVGYHTGESNYGIVGTSPDRKLPGGKINHCTFYGLLENNYSRYSDYIGNGEGKIFDSNLHGDDLTDDATLTAYLNSFSGNDIYREALQYPFAINISYSGPGRMMSSVRRTHPGKSVTLTPTGEVESLDIKDADGKKVDYTYNEENRTYSFVMPKRDVTINVTFKQNSEWVDKEGDMSDPYIINSQDSWDMFVIDVNNGNSYFGKYIRLETDVIVTETVGRRGTYPFNYPFSGTLLGNGHTITANISSSTYGSGPNEQGVAPFHYIKYATIKDLTVTGSITSASYHTGGLVGFADDSNLIENCTVRATITTRTDYVGGIIGNGLSSATTIRGCVFAGTITGVVNDADNIGGIWGWSNSGTPELENCIEVGTYNIVWSMHPIGLQGGAGTVTGCYYLNPQRGMPKNACTLSGAMRLYTAEPSNEIYKPMTINGATYYVPCAITVNEVYPHTGSDITIDEPTLTTIGSTLKKDIDYTYTVSPAPVKDKGVYALTFTGQGDYSGTKTVNIYVTIEDIAATNGSLTPGKYMVNDDVTFEDRLNISGNVILHLAEGKTLHAKKGIELTMGNTLTIEGQGTLLIDQCEDDKSGIGAIDPGTLVINGGTINVTGGLNGAALGGDIGTEVGSSITINGGVVNATGGENAAGIGGGYASHTSANVTINGGVVNATGGGKYAAGIGGGSALYSSNGGHCGTIVINGGQVTAIGGEKATGIGPGYGPENSGTLILGYTDETDFVYSSGCTIGNDEETTLNSITFADGKQFLLDGTSTIATTDNIDGKKIVPYVKRLLGEGTADRPYTISNADDWNTFVREVYEGTVDGYKDKHVTLTADIEVTTMVGSDGNHTFRGTFDGGGHTLTVSYTSDEQYAAPFQYTYGATIKNLNTAGTINTSNINAGGVVGRNGTQNTTLENVSSSVTINSTFSGRAYHGGLMGYAINATFKNCIFTGKILGSLSHHCGGMLGQKSVTEGSNASFTSCLFNPEEITAGGYLSYPFAAGAHYLATVADDCYYAKPFGGVQGIQVSAAPAADEINKKVTANDGNDYYMSCTVGNVVEGYQYTGVDIAVTAPTVTAGDGTVLTAGEDFTFTPATVKDIKDDTEEGDHYTLTVSGVEAKGYYGSKSFSFIVGSGNPVTSTTTELSDGEYAVYGDITVNSRIVINGDVTLNLPLNKTLTAKKGIELAAGNSLTIKGAGTLVVKGCDDNKSGIGAESMGTLNIEGGWLTISGGMNAPGIGSDNAANPSGTLTLGWNYTDDYIDCSSYAVSNLSFAEGKQFVVEHEQIIATTDNIGGQKIIPAVVLANTGDNTAALEAHDKYGISVALNDRTIYLDGDWNTLCVPFELSLNRFDGLEARTLTAASIEGTTLNLTFSDPVDKLEAGVPYIIKSVEKKDGYVSGPLYDLVNPVFHNVVIDKTTHNCVFGSGDTQVSFIGTYKSQTFSADDRSILFLGADNTLYYPQAGASIGAFRGYFRLKLGDNEVKAFKLNFGDGETTGIEAIDNLTIHNSQFEADAWYTLDGRRLGGRPSRAGVYINNGKKVVIK